MRTVFRILLTVSIISLVLGFIGLGNGMAVGFCRAIGAVFFCLAFITKVIEKAETEEATAGRAH